MSKIQVQTTIDTDAFLLGAAELQLNELEHLARELEAVIVRKKSAGKKYRERELIHHINQTVLENGLRERYMALVEKLEDGSLTQDEQNEFLVLVEKDEQLRNDRVKYLIELAQLRNISLSQLMDDLGLNPVGNE